MSRVPPTPGGPSNDDETIYVLRVARLLKYTNDVTEFPKSRSRGLPFQLSHVSVLSTLRLASMSFLKLIVNLVLNVLQWIGISRLLLPRQPVVNEIELVLCQN